ncbi:MAG: DUF2442 domain-containing protein [Chitinophagales bacterium]
MFPKLLEAKSLPDYTLSLKFDDGISGKVSLRNLIDTEVFSPWKTSVDFNQVFIVRNNIIAWSDEMEIDADALYLELRGLTFEQWKEESHAAIK